mgnify:FL=1
MNRESEYKQILAENSKKLRREMTQEERHLWYDFLKKLPVSVYRQKVFCHYIVDFYIAKEKIIIELDGLQHGEEKNQQADVMRDDYFNKNGYKVLRYTNKQINSNFEGVCKDILWHLKIEESDL